MREWMLAFKAKPAALCVIIDENKKNLGGTKDESRINKISGKYAAFSAGNQ